MSICFSASSMRISYHLFSLGDISISEQLHLLLRKATIWKVDSACTSGMGVVFQLLAIATFLCIVEGTHTYRRTAQL